jgi:hypothetical protein
MSSYLEEEHPDAQITQDIAAWMKESKLGVDDVRVVLCKPSVIKLPRSDGKDNCLVLAMPKEKKHANIPPLVLPIMNTHYAQWKFNVKSSDILDGQLKACDSKAAGIIKDINNRIIMGEDVARKTLSSPNFGSKETTIRELIYCVKNKKNLEELRSLTGAELRKHEAALKEMTLTIYETEALVESGQTAAKGVGAWRYLYTIVNDTLIGLGIFDSHTNPLKAWKP